MKNLFIVFLALLPLALASDGWVPVVKKAKKQIVRIEIMDGKQNTYVCSGVVLNAESGHVLSCAHCFRSDRPENLSITVNGRHAELARTNSLLDQAVLRFSVKDELAMAIADQSPEEGTEVAVLGHAFGVKEIAVQFGAISQTYNEETKTIWLDANIIPGDSGGAVIDKEGRLVGLTSRIYHDGGRAHMSAAMPVEQIKDFVQQYLPKPAAK